jgi:CheY-like chemotaxis protein
MNSSKPILLIENNNDDVKDIETALNDIHVTNILERRSNIDDAYEYLRDERKPKPCIILLDLNLPRMGAFEFIKTLKADHILKRLPIIVLMSSESNGDVARSSGPDIAGYILKPFDYRQFIETTKKLNIHLVLNRKENRQ